MKIDVNGPEHSDTVATSTTPDVLFFQDNGDQIVVCDSGVCGSSSVSMANQAVTFTETGANTGLFTNWDDSLKTNMYINPLSDRGNQATFWWDDVEYSVLNMPYWGTIEFNTSGTQVEIGTDIGAEWNSGELVEVVVDDGDMNLDSRSQEQMTVSANSTIVPAVKIGSPITLASLDTLHFYDSSTAAGTTATSLIDENIGATQCSTDYTSGDGGYVSCYEKYSERAIVTYGNSTDTPAFADGDELRFRYGDGTNQYASVGDLKDLIAGANGTAAYTYINYDFRAFNGGTNDPNYFLNFTIGDNEVSSGGSNEVRSYSGSGTTFTTEVVTQGCEGLIGSCLINSPDQKLRFEGDGDIDTGDDLNVIVTIQNQHASDSLDKLSSGNSYGITMDFVTYGQSNDGVSQADRHNNGIWRLEVKENGVNSNVMKSELDYILLNQINVNQTSTYNITKTDFEENLSLIHI